MVMYLSNDMLYTTLRFCFLQQFVFFNWSVVQHPHNFFTLGVPGLPTVRCGTAYLLGRDVVGTGAKIYPSIGIDAGQDKENACWTMGVVN
jgi:hypothetical protein